jgi:hypothetical protein
MWHLIIEEFEKYNKLNFKFLRLDQAYSLIEMIQKTTTEKLVYTLKFEEVQNEV